MRSRNNSNRTTDFNGRVIEIIKTRKDLPSLIQKNPMEITSIRDGKTVKGDLPSASKIAYKFKQKIFNDRMKIVVEEFTKQDGDS